MHKRFMPGMHTILYNVSVVRGRGETQAGGGEYGEKKFFLFKSMEGGGGVVLCIHASVF